MTLNLKLILSIVVVIIVVAGLGIWLLPGDESEITGAAVGATTTAGEECPTGDDFQIISQCKAWTNSRVKAAGLEILSDDSLDEFCDKILKIYPNC